MDFKYLKDFMDRLTAQHVPGNSIVVYHENKEVFRYSSGYNDVESKIPMTGDELLNIYSCTKPATVTAALQLYEKGFFLLDDPLYAYMPEFRDMYVMNDDGSTHKAINAITMRHLFTMTSGFTYEKYSPSMQQAIVETNGKMPTVQALRYLAKEPLAFEPGSRWKYSLSHDVLAAVVEIISGKRFQDYVKENVFAPIGVTDIHFHQTEDTLQRTASQYMFKTDEEIEISKGQISSAGKDGHWEKQTKDNDLLYGPEYDSGGAGILVSVPEYAKFASCLANGGVAPNGEQILSGGTIELLRTNQLNDIQLKDFNWSQLSGYGYGLGVRTMINRKTAGFNGPCSEFGWGGAAGATLSADPDSKFAYFYAHHMLVPKEEYYQPRLRNVAYACLYR